jgi:hypothetical protein
LKPEEADGRCRAVEADKVVRERGYFRLEENEVKLAIRTSRVFKKIDGRWKQVHHHGSIDDPELLARYQTAVLGTQK